MEIYDLPINFKVYGISEKEAVRTLLKQLAYHFVYEPEIVSYELFEFIPTDEEDAKYCCHI